MAEKERKRKCFKCGCSTANDNVKLFRFPKPAIRNLLRCELWAKFIFPERISTVELQTKLHNEHRMLCQKHFLDSDFADDSKIKLFRTAVPCDSPRDSFSSKPDEETSTQRGDEIQVQSYKRSRKSDYKTSDSISKEKCVPMPTCTNDEDTHTSDENKFIEEASVASDVPQNEIFSWQKNVEVVLESGDEITAEKIPDTLSLYCDDKDSQPTVTNSHGKTHDNHIDHQYVCNFCSESITGFRYRCVQCSDCDLCACCEAAGCHPEHYVLRVPPYRPHAEVLSVLSMIRSQLLGGDNPLLTGDVTNDLLEDSVKEEVKEEEEQCEPDPLRAEGSQPGAESVERVRPYHGDADPELTAEASDVEDHRTPPLERLLCRQRERSVSLQECGEDGLCEVPDGSDPLRPYILPVAFDYTSRRKKKQNDMNTSSSQKTQITPISYATERKWSVSSQESGEDGLCNMPVMSDSLRPHVSPVASKDTCSRKRKQNDMETSSNPKRPVTLDPVSLITQHSRPVVALNNSNLKNIIRIKKSQLTKSFDNPR